MLALSIHVLGLFIVLNGIRLAVDIYQENP